MKPDAEKPTHIKLETLEATKARKHAEIIRILPDSVNLVYRSIFWFQYLMGTFPLTCF